MDNGGIVYIPDCSSCASYSIAGTYAFDICTSPDPNALQMSWDGVAGPTTIMFPAFVEYLGQNVDFTLTFDVTEVVPNAGDFCSVAIPIDCGDVVTGTTVGATNSGIPACNGFANTALDMWYSFTGTGGMVSASLCTSGYDTRITVFEGTCTTLTCVDANDDYCGLQSRIDWYAESGVDYFIMVHGYNTSTGAYTLTVDCTDPTTATWIGGDGSYLDLNPYNDWFGADNWDVQDVPGATTNIILPAGQTYYPTIDRSAVCNDISMGSDASGTATLLDNGFLTLSKGTSTVQRYFSGNDIDWHLVSSPIANAQAGIFMDMYLQSFDNSDYSYTDIENEYTALNVMEGYALYSTLGATNTVSFMGSLNLGSQSAAISLGADGYNWNLLGNPYPSSINWEQVTIPTGMTNEVHYIDAATGNDLSYVKGTGGSGAQYIPPMQGFFVSATAGDLLSLGDAQRSHMGAGTFYKDSNPQLVVLEAIGENFTDETWIHFNETAGEEHDGQFDAYKRISLSNPELPQIFSYTPGGVKLSINGMPEVESVPVGFTAVESGVFTINAKESGEFTELYLEDLFTNYVTNLLENDYSFSYSAGDQQNRFILHFGALGVDDVAGDLFNIYSFNKDVYVAVPAHTSGTITVYDMMGQEVTSTSINNTVNVITLDKSAYYIVKVLSNENMETKKVFIK
jgi:hypothetical protein